MPDRRSHRGPHQSDVRLFGAEQVPTLRSAVHDLQWLLSRGYAETSSLELVGNRYRLSARQRTAVGRCACSAVSQERRLGKQVAAAHLAGGRLDLDGFNVLVTVEAALAGSVVLKGSDGAYRDLCSVHGTYRRVEETLSAVSQIGETLSECRAASCRWYLDRPVSNSGRLKYILLETAEQHGWTWEVELVANPDTVLAKSSHVIASSDRMVLDRCTAWFNLARQVIDRRIPKAWVLDLDVPARNSPPDAAN